MYLLAKISIMALCLVGLVAAQKGRNLAQVLMESRDASNDIPVRSLACFGYYIPVLNDITNEYERSYAACLDNSKDARSAIDEETHSETQQLEINGRNSCDLLSECNSHQNSIEYLECYNKRGNENSKAMYAIAANASEVLTRVREEYRLIENEEYRCTNKTESIYIESYARTYEEMQACLQGKIPIPVPTPAPEDGPTDSTSETDIIESKETEENGSSESNNSGSNESGESSEKPSTVWNPGWATGW